MFTRTSHLLAAVSAAGKAEGEASALRERVAELKTSLDWMRVRVNQLEKERAVLLREVTHLNIPTIELAPSNAMSTSVPVGMSLPTFEDLGDSAAAQLGISHDDNGELEYK